ncbi:hypothetical protein GUJ93_ZPchr0006g40768 [Zizania palustris]|uniref:Uncharacterized protein n=1 Tax=Zizania palustris TaxID=103762 RepID=A0A8J5SN59_ZIZPA|nr:hypothetical protein GUJ93_ZPchr0006g40768 [Zizania palustris]
MPPPVPSTRRPPPQAALAGAPPPFSWPPATAHACPRPRHPSVPHRRRAPGRRPPDTPVTTAVHPGTPSPPPHRLRSDAWPLVTCTVVSWIGWN